MAEPVRAWRLTDQEGRRLQQIVRRGKHGSGQPGGASAAPPGAPAQPAHHQTARSQQQKDPDAT